jgi:hypothetical protein
MIRRIKIQSAIFHCLATAVIYSGCGANLYDAVEPSDPATDAVLALENNKPKEAIEIAEGGLESDPDNYQLISILASAYAQKAGLSPLDFALQLAEQQSSGSAGSGITTTFGALPDATTENISSITIAIAALESIPSDHRTTGDKFKMSMLYTAKMGLLAKQFSDTVSGNLTVENLQNLTPDQAIEILSSLGGAAGAIAALDTSGDGNSAKAAAQITAIQAKIDEQEGADQTEKLRNYLATQQQSQSQ